MTRTITIETNCQQIELDVECSYNPSDTGGSYEGRDYEQLGDDYSVRRILRNGIDITDRIEKFCKGLFERIESHINEN